MANLRPKLIFCYNVAQKVNIFGKLSKLRPRDQFGLAIFDLIDRFKSLVKPPINFILISNFNLKLKNHKIHHLVLFHEIGVRKIKSSNPNFKTKMMIYRCLNFIQLFHSKKNFSFSYYFI